MLSIDRSGVQKLPEPVDMVGILQVSSHRRPCPTGVTALPLPRRLRSASKHSAAKIATSAMQFSPVHARRNLAKIKNCDLSITVVHRPTSMGRSQS
jgi:hypothetical protein